MSIIDKSWITDFRSQAKGNDVGRYKNKKDFN
jgi:hypothetical protein